MTEELTQEEQQILANYISQNYPKPEEKAGVFHFFNKILKIPETIRTGNLNEDELFAVRNLLRAKIFSEEKSMDKVSKYFAKRAEIVTGTSLSRLGFLIQAVITTKKESKAKIKTGEDKKKKWGQKEETV
jgi:hypothetical protein